MTGRLELPTFPVAPAAPPPVPGCASPGECDGLIGRAKALSWLSLAWMTVEGAVAITAAQVYTFQATVSGEAEPRV